MKFMITNIYKCSKIQIIRDVYFKIFHLISVAVGKHYLSCQVNLIFKSNPDAR